MTVRFLMGDRLYLRPVEESDLPRAQVWINDPEVWRFLGTYRPFDARAERAWWEGQDRSLVPRSLTFAVVLFQDDEHIGNTGFNRIDWLQRVAETGTLIGEKQHWGKGYGTEAKELLLRYAFDTLGLYRIESRVLAFNERSAGHLRRTGFVEEGREREALFRDGRRWDMLRFGLLEPEWRARQAARPGGVSR